MNGGHWKYLTDEQWAVIEPLSPKEEQQPRVPGWPWRPARDISLPTSARIVSIELL